MKRIFFVIVTICIIIHYGFSQEKEDPGIRIIIRGLVMDANTFTPLAGSQIMINRTFSSVTNSDGIFVFYVSRKDTVVFKSLGYKSTTLFITDTIIGREFIAGIYMQSDTLSIGEVVIVPRLTNLKSEILNTRSKIPATMENARYNVAISAYQGRSSMDKLGDPAYNYTLLRQKQKVDAYEKGGIPSDKILTISPLLLIPAAYLLMHGLPEYSSSLKPQLTRQEVDQIHMKYLETLKQKR